MKHASNSFSIEPTSTINAHNFIFRSYIFFPFLSAWHSTWRQVFMAVSVSTFAVCLFFPEWGATIFQGLRNILRHYAFKTRWSWNVQPYHHDLQQSKTIKTFNKMNTLVRCFHCLNETSCACVLLSFCSLICLAYSKNFPIIHTAHTVPF